MGIVQCLVSEFECSERRHLCRERGNSGGDGRFVRYRGTDHIIKYIKDNGAGS